MLNTNHSNAFKYKKPHFKSLKGEALSSRLCHLAKIANANHGQADLAWNRSLTYARKAGEALIEAKERVPHGQWAQWLESNFRGKPRTARNYMHIVRKWWDPRLAYARSNGFTPHSISGVLSILEGKKPSPEELSMDMGAGEPDKLEMMRQSVREQFALKVRKLKREELEILCDWLAFDEAWDVLYADLKQTVCLVADDDFYDLRTEEERDEELAEKERVNLKITAALNH